MKRAMISQPMAGLTDKQIEETRDRNIERLIKEGYEPINTWFKYEWYDRERILEREIVHIPLAFLAKSVEHMAQVEVVLFCKGWEKARGCKIEHNIAKEYGLSVIYEK